MDFNTPIVIGRSKNDFLDYKTKGAIYLGKNIMKLKKN